MISRRGVLQGGALLAASVALAACGNGGGARLQNPGAGAGRNDVNPQPRDAVRDGGDLRWPLDALPDNLNRRQTDGSTVDTKEVTAPLLPRDHLDTPDGGFALDPNYFTSIELTSTSPQVVTYTINAKAVWSDGTPISWRDLEAQWRALNGTNPAFQIVSSTGWTNITSVVRGVDDRQAVVTFGDPLAEWQGQFNPLYPASTTTDPATFNTGWINKAPVTAGPFRLGSVDEGAQTITLVRNERWWGDRPKLDRIIFKVTDRGALADGLANNEIDFYTIGSSVDLLRRAQGTPGAAIRRATERSYNHLTFNGAPGSILADVRLRQAVAKAVDRTAIARRLVGQIVPEATSLNNHIYPYGTRYYRDNAGVMPYDEAAANRELDALGWRRPAPDGVRAKDGGQLRLRLVGDTANPISEAIHRTVLDQLGRVGIAVELQQVSATDKGTYIRSGNFDLIGFGWESTSTPFSSGQALYAEPKGNDVQQNYGRIYSPEITALFDQGIKELDDAQRAELGNRVDELIWREVHHLPLYPATGAYAVRSTLANFGAPGFADVDYVNAGFVK